jgi:hypothetical protein
MSETIHVGKGTFLGHGATVFPVWTSGADMTNVCFKTKHLTVTEIDGAPDVNHLSITNNGHRDHIVVEGDIFEGGWQNRVAATTVLIARGQTVRVPVACVEQGRWHGGREHGVQVRRAPYRTRGRLNQNLMRNEYSGLVDASAAQSAVWEDIQLFESRVGATPGHSLSAAMGLLEGPSNDVARVSLLPGQRGVMIGIGGYIVAAEIFGSHEALKQRFDAIVEAARFEGMNAQNRSTPNYMARDFATVLEHSQIERGREMPEHVSTPVGPLAISSFSLAAGLVHAAVFNNQHA